MRAVAELTSLGGFLGSMGIEPSSLDFRRYRECVEYLNARHSFRSVMASGLVAAVEGNYGHHIPDALEGRVGEGCLFLWPVMATIFAFDPVVVAERSLVSHWIRDCEHRVLCDAALAKERSKLEKSGRLLGVSEFPRHAEVLARRFRGDHPGASRDIVISSKGDEPELASWSQRLGSTGSLVIASVLGALASYLAVRLSSGR
jgi:hypothetical protein